ncbi:MFS transporter [Streptomyces yaanensis]|uniref:MFS transporter n=1 Tax=Streptomyces yaanensis TaxID=1142239 RepID=A0ABV7S6L9_9ACTN|nr:MFS transporter [Streptomyces sp. CGMCC 4.7035]WNB99567.1 MFS transporter [Streptomyces sp. CGMCC 4.7035]
MPTTVRSATDPVTGDRSRHTVAALAAAVVGFFVVTLDATIVNVALPTIRDELGGGMTGLQWVVDGYTLMFAALLLSAGALSDRIGARRAFGAGVAVFVAASAACGLAPTLGVLVAARFVQGAGAAIVMPTTLALIREVYGDQGRRARAVAVWAMGGAAAAAAGPLAGAAHRAQLAADLLHQRARRRRSPVPAGAHPAVPPPEGAVRPGRAGGRRRGDGRTDVRGDRSRRGRFHGPPGDRRPDPHGRRHDGVSHGGVPHRASDGAAGDVPQWSASTGCRSCSVCTSSSCAVCRRWRPGSRSCR